MSTTVYTNSKYYHDIADAIRAKNGTSDTYTPAEMAPAILNLEAGEGPAINNQNKSVNPTEAIQTITADTGYTGLGQVTIEPISSTYVGSSVTKKGAATIIPGTSNQTIADGTYLTGTQTIIGDTDLIATNIKSGVNIFNVAGTFTSDADATAADISAGKTAYVNGIKLTGTASGVDGIDMPTFTIIWDDNYEEILSITCDKTFSEIEQGLLNMEYFASRIDSYTEHDSYVADRFLAVLAEHVYTQEVIYTTSTNFIPMFDMHYRSDGTAEFVSPSAFAKVLNVTQNGTYTPDSGIYTEVNVNVPQPSGSINITSNGTHDVTNYASAVVNVSGSEVTINNQNKTVTPTKSKQTLTADSGYTGLGTVTVNAIPSQYITTTDVTAVAADILLNKTAYVNGSKITGSMPNNGATGTTITSPSGSYTIPAGYTTGGTVNVDLPVSTLTNSIINGSAELEDTNDYAFEVEVNIPAGYHDATTLTKSFSSILPAPDNAIAANQMLAGYQAYSADGELLTGSMVNNGTWSRILDQTTTSVTIPAGYHNGTGTVSHTTVDIPDPTISVNSSGLITASGSWTRGFTVDSSYSKTQQLTTQTAKTVTPTESEQNAVAAGVYTTGIVKVGAIPSDYIGSDITQRDSDDLTVSGATVTAPAGYYSAAASKSVATMTLPTAASSTSTSGATRKATINRSSSIQYINIPTGYNSTAAYYQVNAVADGVATAPSTITGTDATLSAGTNTLILSKILSVTPRITTAGYVSSGTAGDSMVTLSTSIPTRNEGSISISGKTVTVPAGYYAEQSSVEVNTMTLPTSVSETSAGSRKLTVSPSTSVQYINIPTGYNESAGYYRIDAMTEGTVTAPSAISGSGASVQSTGSNTVTVRGTVSVTPNVTTAGYIDAGTAGNSTVTLSVNMTTKAASTITPGASAQTISGGTYLTGTQTIAGDADLVAGNIKSGVNIFGVSGTFTSDATAGPTEIVSGATAYVDGDLVTGTLTVNKYYTGATAPSASLGNNGDIYLQQ